MEGNITPEEKKIKDLEAKVLNLELSQSELLLANAKLGYSTKLMSEFHLTQDDKLRIGNSIDLAENTSDVKKVYDEYFKMLNNKHLPEESSDFQMSDDFKSNIRAYFNLASGYDIISTISENLSIVIKYFSLENKIRSTPKAELRQPMVDKLLEERPITIEAVDNIVDIIKTFDTEES